MKLVLNASPLIHITRAGHSRIFKSLKEFAELMIPGEVYKDVVLREKEKGASDAYLLDKIIHEETITITDIADKQFLDLVQEAASKSLKPLHEGEVEVLALAKEKDALAIIDESAATAIGRTFNIQIRGSMYLFVLLYKRNAVGKKEVIEAFEDMVKTGWRISSKDYKMIREELERI